MSVRLNVVLSQSAGGPPRLRDFESDVVARLIAAAGIDLSLIGPLQSLGSSATDRLMLDGLRSDLALLSWFTPKEAAEHLARAGMHGRRAPHRLDSPADVDRRPEAASTAPSRRIYYFDLRRHASAGALHSALEELLAARRVVTFQLGGVGPTGAGDSPKVRGPISTGQPEGDDRITAPAGAMPSAHPPVLPRNRDAASAPSEAGADSAHYATVANAAAHHESGSAARAIPREAEPDRWDALVDELNDSDV